jgi:hypothetical protein
MVGGGGGEPPLATPKKTMTGEFPQLILRRLSDYLPPKLVCMILSPITRYDQHLTKYCP